MKVIKDKLTPSNSFTSPAFISPGPKNLIPLMVRVLLEDLEEVAGIDLPMNGGNEAITSSFSGTDDSSAGIASRKCVGVFWEILVEYQ